MSWEGISKYISLLILALEGPDPWWPSKIGYLCYKSETLQNRSSAEMKYNKVVLSLTTLLNPNL